LENLNGHYIRQTADGELVQAIEQLLPHLASGREIAAKLDAPTRAKLLAAIPVLKERAKNLVELLDSASFIWAERPLKLDEKAQALLTPDARTLLSALSKDLSAVEPWSAEATERDVRAFAEKLGLKLGAVAQPLRAAVTGRSTSPGIFEVLEVL